MWRVCGTRKLKFVNKAKECRIERSAEDKISQLFMDTNDKKGNWM